MDPSLSRKNSTGGFRGGGSPFVFKILKIYIIRPLEKECAIYRSYYTSRLTRIAH